MSATRLGTSDGISEADWEGITEIAFRMADAIINHDEVSEAADKASLLSALDVLHKKYGDKPSILASRAEFLDDKQQCVDLFEKAYALAEQTDDFQNKTSITSSLADLYWDYFQDRENTEIWLEKLETGLRDYHDDSEQETYESLRRALSIDTQNN